MANKINARFDHSSTHCAATNCTLRADCIHYLAFLEAIEMKLPDFKVKCKCENHELEYVRVRIEK